MDILLVDDDNEARRTLDHLLRKAGHSVVQCGSKKQACATLAANSFTLLLVAIKLPDMSAPELLREIKRLKTSSEIIVMTDADYVQKGVEAMSMGAYCYLTKPVRRAELEATLARLTELIALKKTAGETGKYFADGYEGAGRTPGKATQAPANVVYVSGASREIVELALRFNRDRQIPVLIEGETGTGKEVVARLVHFGQGTAQGPFVEINCAALNPLLFESELFGYDPGAFTGSLARGNKGKFDLADRGTLFLDEISEIPYDLQGKLLRVLEEKAYFRVGGLKKIKTDVRIIGASNTQLEKAVREGKFRKDLYYRLKVGYIRLPPLRDRPEDILPLAESFLQRFAREKHKKFRAISRGAQEMLLAYPWPGNIRELRNIIELATFLFQGEEIRAEHLTGLGTGGGAELEPPPANPAEFVLPLPSGKFPLQPFIDKIIVRALEKYDGNVSRTARYLCLSRRALTYRLAKITRQGILPFKYPSK